MTQEHRENKTYRITNGLVDGYNIGLMSDADEQKVRLQRAVNQRRGDSEAMKALANGFKDAQTVKAQQTLRE